MEALIFLFHFHLSVPFFLVLELKNIMAIITFGAAAVRETKATHYRLLTSGTTFTFA